MRVGGANNTDEIAHHGEQQNIAPRDAGMRDIAANRDGQPGDPPLVAADGQRIQQRLGRVLMRAVPGIDHRRIHLLRQQRRRAGAVVAHHQQVAIHRIQGRRRVQQGLALGDRRAGDRHVDHIGAEPLARQLEARAGARGILEKQVDQRAARAADRAAFCRNGSIKHSSPRGRAMW